SRGIRILCEHLRRSRTNRGCVVLSYCADCVVSNTSERDESDSLLEAELRNLFRIVNCFHALADQTRSGLELSRENRVEEIVSGRVSQLDQSLRGGQFYRSFLIVERFFQCGNRSGGSRLSERCGGCCANIFILVAGQCLLSRSSGPRI